MDGSGGSRFVGFSALGMWHEVCSGGEQLNGKVEDPPMHEEWPLLLEELKGLGLLSDLEQYGARLVLGPAADRSPEDSALAELMHVYYEAGGDHVEALWRRQSDRYIEVAADMAPGEVAAHLRHAFPVIGGLSATIGADALWVSCDDEQVSVSRYVRHARIRDLARKVATTRPRDVVRGANVLLSRFDVDRRFVELFAPSGRSAFVATTADQARELVAIGVTPNTSLTKVWRFGAWEDGRQEEALPMVG